MRRLLAVSAIMLCCFPPAADAAQSVKLAVSFTPDRLGASTTIGFGFTITASKGDVPPPLTDVNLHLPSGMDLSSSTMGEVACHRKALLDFGVAGCSPNSRMGYGVARVVVRVESQLIYEPATVGVFIGVPENSRTTLLFYSEGVSPVYAQLIFSCQLLPDFGQFGGRLNTVVPLIPTWPGGPDASVVGFRSTIGPAHLLYRRRTHGQVITYHPKGIGVPLHCPKGGFPFAADFGFLDGTHTTARKTIPCPSR